MNCLAPTRTAGSRFTATGCCDEEALTRCQGFFGGYGNFRVGKMKKPVRRLGTHGLETEHLEPGFTVLAPVDEVTEPTPDCFEAFVQVFWDCGAGSRR